MLSAIPSVLLLKKEIVKSVSVKLEARIGHLASTRERQAENGPVNPISLELKSEVLDLCCCCNERTKTPTSEWTTLPTTCFHESKTNLDSL